MADTNVQIKLSADGSQVRNEIKLIDQQLQQLGNNVGIPQLNLGAGVTPISQQQQTQQLNNPLQRQRDRTLTHLYREFLVMRREIQGLNRGFPVLATALQNLSAQVSQTGSPLPHSQTNLNSTRPLPSFTTQHITIDAESVIVNNSGKSSSSTKQSGTSSSNKQKSGGKSSPGYAERNFNVIMGRMTRMLGVMSIFSFLKNAGQMDYDRQKMAYQTYGHLGTDSNFSAAARRATDWGKSMGFDYNEVLPTIQANQATAGFKSLAAQQSDIQAILGASRAYNIDSSTLASSSGRMTATGLFSIGGQQKFANMLAKSIKENGMQGREREQLSVLESIHSSLSARLPTVTAESMNSATNIYTALSHINPNLRGERGGSLATRMIDIANSHDEGLDIMAGLGTTYTGITGELELMKMKESDPQKYYQKIWKNYLTTYGDNPNDEFSATNQLMYKFTKGMGMSYHDAEAAVNSIKAGHQFDTSMLKDDGEGEDEITKRLKNYQQTTMAVLDNTEIRWNEFIAGIGAKVNEVKARRDYFVSGMQGLMAMGKLTANDLNLNVDIYDAQKYYKETKDKWFSLSVD